MSGKSDRVFVIEGKNLRPLLARPWRAGLFGKTLEDALQTLLEKHPDVLPGQQIDPGSDDPPRFVLLYREMPLGGWSVDHLLVDQRRVLTLVEAKLIQDPGARRAVVGQILEYAANAAASWGNGRTREKAIAFWRQHGGELRGKDTSIDEVMHEVFGEEIDLEAFWDDVEENLRRGRFRMIIAGDELRPEVRRTIEYLNSEMRTAEIYGLELPLYGDESGPLVLAPRLIGKPIKEPSDVILWSMDLLRAAYASLPDHDLGERLRKVLDWAEKHRFFLIAKAKTPVFGLRGRSGARIVSFSPAWTFCYLDEKSYPHGKADRDGLVAELKGLGMYGPDFNPEGVVAGKNLARRLTELGEDEFGRLLEIFSRYCGAAERS